MSEHLLLDQITLRELAEPESTEVVEAHYAEMAASNALDPNDPETEAVKAQANVEYLERRKALEEKLSGLSWKGPRIRNALRVSVEHAEGVRTRIPFLGRSGFEKEINDEHGYLQLVQAGLYGDMKLHIRRPAKIFPPRFAKDLEVPVTDTSRFTISRRHNGEKNHSYHPVQAT
jgi:hypothetical protein